MSILTFKHTLSLHFEKSLSLQNIFDHISDIFILTNTSIYEITYVLGI